MAKGSPSTHSSALLTEFAPRGALRVALNHGNPILVGRTPDGASFGISVEIAHALAEYLGVDLRFVEYDRAADVSLDAAYDRWDVCFLAFDPKRAEAIDFTKPYLKIAGSYLAGPAATARDAEELVVSGAPVGTVKGSAYTLTLQRMPGSEHLVLFESFESLLSALDDGRVASVAGIDPVMRAEAEKRPGARVLSPPFMEICQAIGMPRGRPHAKTELEKWLSSMLQEENLAGIVERYGLSRECILV